MVLHLLCVEKGFAGDWLSSVPDSLQGVVKSVDGVVLSLQVPPEADVTKQLVLLQLVHVHSELILRIRKWREICRKKTRFGVFSGLQSPKR